MGKKASDITRILSAIFQFGDTIINLEEKDHKAVLSGLLNLLTSYAGNNDAVASRETVADFISDVKVTEFKQYQITVTDEVKTVSCNGETLLNLLNAWGMVTTEWHVDRGGKRQYTKESPAKLGSLQS